MQGTTRARGHIPRRAAEQPPRRDPPRADETRPVGRTAEQDPARRLPRPSRSRGGGDHPPGRARHTSRTPFVHATTPRPPGDQPMTIRSGGRPRDGRVSPAHPYDPDAYATEYDPRILGARSPRRPSRRWAPRWQCRRAPQVPRLRARPRGGRPGGRPDGPAAGRRRRGHGHRRRQSGRPPAAVRQGHRGREARPGAHDAGVAGHRPRSSSSSSRATRPGRSPPSSRRLASSPTAGRSCSSRSNAT